MDERRRQALKKHQQRLQMGILVQNILPTLRPELTEVEYEQVQARKNNVAKVDELIKILLTKENKHFDAFCKALEGNGYSHCAIPLQEEVGGTIGR